MHLRWIYVKDHALLFVALTAVSIAALLIAVVLVDDPARGLLLGITPTLFALLVWAFTNRAGYPDRVPETLAHQRTSPTDGQPAGEVSAWNPFELDRPISPAAPPAPTGDSPAPTPPEATAPDPKPKRPAPRKQLGREAPAGDPLVSNPPPASSDEPREHLTPDEAAKRKPEARKSRKRKGNPDAAA